MPVPSETKKTVRFGMIGIELGVCGEQDASSAAVVLEGRLAWVVSFLKAYNIYYPTNFSVSSQFNNTTKKQAG